MNNRFLISLCLAVVLHLGLLAWWPFQGGAGGGTRAELTVSLRHSISRPGPRQTPPAHETMRHKAAPTTRTVAPRKSLASTHSPRHVARVNRLSAKPESTPKNRPERQHGQLAKQQTGDNPTRAGGAGTTASRRDYLALIRRVLDHHRHYPETARRRRIEGTVKVQFAINDSGNVAGFHITRGSGSDILDHATRTLFNQLRFPPLPPVFGHELSLVVPISYRLD